MNQLKDKYEKYIMFGVEKGKEEADIFMQGTEAFGAYACIELLNNMGSFGRDTVRDALDQIMSNTKVETIDEQVL